MKPSPSTDTPPAKADAPVRLRVDVYDVLAAAKGYKTVTAQAAWHGLNRTYLSDIRAGRNIPRLETAMRMAGDLGVAVEVIFERVTTP